MKKIIHNLRIIFIRNRSFVLINILGLGIGLAVSLVLLLFVATELSFDHHFSNKERIIRLNTVWVKEGIKNPDAICIRSAYTDLPSKVPGIESAVQIYRGFHVELTQDEKRFQNINLLYTDPEIFEVFKMDFLSGIPSSALKGAYTAVITDQMARKVFGNLDVVGKTFSIQKESFIITAVVKSLPKNSHFTFDILASMNSVSYLSQLGGMEFFTYYLLKQGVAVPEVSRLINHEYTGMLSERFKDFDYHFESATEKLTDIYLHSKVPYGLGATGSVSNVLILAGLAFLILLLAITNFVNLFIVQGNQRALEVGIRKTLGGSLKNIALQFFSEASVIVFISFIIAAFLGSALMRPFSALIHKTIEPSLIGSPFFVSGILLLLLVTIILSASYPAFYLSHFRPAEVLKKSGKSSKRKFSASIAVFQSVITIVLIAAILVIHKQVKYLHDVPKGYSSENVMIITDLNDKLMGQYKVLRQELEKTPGIFKVSAAQHIIGEGTSGQGIRLVGNKDQNIRSINEYRVLPGVSEIMQLEFTEGSDFGDNDSLNTKSVIINEAAAKMLGIYGSAIGRSVIMFEDPMEITGVVHDFYYDSPAKTVQPIALTCYEKKPSSLYIRFDSGFRKTMAVQTVLPVFRGVDPDFIMNHRWSDDIYAGKFEKEQSLSGIVKAGTLLSLIIALLGIIAIHATSTSQRTKEIGIRKVLGSKAGSIVFMLSGEVVKLVAIAGVLSIPLSLYISKTWLSNYSNHYSGGWYLIILPILLQFMLVMMTTIFISIRVSVRNPVEALRYE